MTSPQYAVEDLRDIFEKGKFYPPCVIAKAQRHISLTKEYESNSFIASSDEEDVDDLDGGPDSQYYLKDGVQSTSTIEDEDDNSEEEDEEESQEKADESEEDVED